MSRAVGENVATAKFAAPEMLTAGPVRSLGGASSRLLVSWRRVSFSGVRRDVQEEVHSEGLVPVEKGGAAADVVDPAHVPGVVARDVVEAVARGQERPRPGPVVEADEDVRGVVAGGEEPRRDARPRVGGGVETRVDGGDRRRGNGDDARRVEARLLEVGEEERAVGGERASQGGTVLPLPERVLGGSERVLRVEGFVAEERVAPSLPGVGPGTGQDVHGSRRGPSELRDPPGGDDLELADHLGGVERPGEVRGVVVRGEAVHHERVVDEALAGDGDPGAGDGGGLGEPLVPHGIAAGHGGGEGGEVEVVPAVQGQAVDVVGHDRFRDLGPHRLDEGRFGDDVDLLRPSFDLQADDHLHRLAHGEPHAPDRGSEPRVLHAQLVGVGGEVEEAIAATGVGGGREGEAPLQAPGVDGCVRDRGAARVLHPAGHGGLGHGLLGPCGPRKRQECDNEDPSGRRPKGRAGLRDDDGHRYVPPGIGGSWTSRARWRRGAGERGAS